MDAVEQPVVLRLEAPAVKPVKETTESEDKPAGRQRTVGGVMLHAGSASSLGLGSFAVHAFGTGAMATGFGSLAAGGALAGGAAMARRRQRAKRGVARWRLFDRLGGSRRSVTRRMSAGGASSRRTRSGGSGLGLPKPRLPRMPSLSGRRAGATGSGAKRTGKTAATTGKSARSARRGRLFGRLQGSGRGMFGRGRTGAGAAGRGRQHGRLGRLFGAGGKNARTGRSRAGVAGRRSGVAGRPAGRLARYLGVGSSAKKTTSARNRFPRTRRYASRLWSIAKTIGGLMRLHDPNKKATQKPADTAPTETKAAEETPQPSGPDTKPGRQITPPTKKEKGKTMPASAGTAGSASVESVVESINTHIGGFQPQNASDIRQWLAGLPRIFEAFSGSLVSTGGRLADEHPVDANVCGHVQEMGGNIARLADWATESHAIFCTAHASELARLDQPRTNEQAWDVTQNT